MRVDNTFTSYAGRGFLVVDGVNGAGKSTLIESISSYLAEKNQQLILTREPGSNSAVGAAVRKLLMDPEISMPDRSELFLFLADRAAHVEQVIEPALATGKRVLSDRYYYSTLAFQGYGRQFDLSSIKEMNAFAINTCLPDLCIMLDLDAEEGLRRTKSRNSDESDRLEAEELDFHKRLQKGFLEIADSCKEPVLVVDASQSAEEVFQTVLPALDSWLESFSRGK